jgi:hypothetical protein
MAARIRRWSSPDSGRFSFVRMLRTCFSTVPSVTHSPGDTCVRPALGHPHHLLLARAKHRQRVVAPAGRDQLLNEPVSGDSARITRAASGPSVVCVGGIQMLTTASCGLRSRTRASNSWRRRPAPPRRNRPVQQTGQPVTRPAIGGGHGLTGVALRTLSLVSGCRLREREPTVDSSLTDAQGRTAEVGLGQLAVDLAMN